MPYRRCPECGITVHSVGGYSTPSACSVCGTALPEEAKRFARDASGIRRTLTREPVAAGSARRVLRGLGGEIEQEVRDVAALLVTELIANSVLHAGPDAGEHLELEVAVMPDRVRVEVRDRGPGFAWHKRPKADPLGFHWGLQLVESSRAAGTSSRATTPSTRSCGSSWTARRPPRGPPGPSRGPGFSATVAVAPAAISASAPKRLPSIATQRTPSARAAATSSGVSPISSVSSRGWALPLVPARRRAIATSSAAARRRSRSRPARWGRSRRGRACSSLRRAIGSRLPVTRASAWPASRSRPSAAAVAASCSVSAPWSRSTSRRM